MITLCSIMNDFDCMGGFPMEENQPTSYHLHLHHISMSAYNLADDGDLA